MFQLTICTLFLLTKICRLLFLVELIKVICTLNTCLDSLLKDKHVYEMLSQLFIIVLSFGSILDGYFIEIKFRISDLFAYFERAMKYFEEII